MERSACIDEWNTGSIAQNDAPPLVLVCRQYNPTFAVWQAFLFEIHQRTTSFGLLH
jgi:hypothetical protein